jgi:hypothetical protein
MAERREGGDKEKKNTRNRETLSEKKTLRKSPHECKKKRTCFNGELNALLCARFKPILQKRHQRALLEKFGDDNEILIDSVRACKEVNGIHKCATYLRAREHLGGTFFCTKKKKKQK